MENIHISSQNMIARMLLTALCLLVLGFAFFAVKWGFANTAAKQADDIELAELTVGLSPNDPVTHYAAAKLLENSFQPDQYDRAMFHYEAAAALSPHKYFAWLELAKARESRGDAEGAMAAFRQAEKLAPNYSLVQWSIGNALVRRGETGAGFEMLRNAAQRHQIYAHPMAALALQINNGDIAKTKAMAGDSPELKNALVRHLISEKRFDDAFSIWNEMAAADRQDNFKETGSSLFSALAAEFRYRQAIAVKKDIGGPPELAADRIFNGDFESQINPVGAELFDWRISEGESPQFALTDGQKHSGNYSLLLLFDPSDRGKTVRSISQAIAVQPGKKYEFESFYKARITTNADLRWIVENAADGQAIASGGPLKGTENWTPNKIAFTAPATGDAIRISLVRDICSQAVCSVTGEIWIDDLSLRPAN